MHLSYPALFAVTHYLKKALPGKSLHSAFTQEKEELILSFDQVLWLRIRCSGRLQYVVPLSSFERSNQNSLDLFPRITGRKISSTDIDPEDRIINIHFGEYNLALRMFGNVSNVVLLHKGNPIEFFLQKPEAEEKYAVWQRKKINTEPSGRKSPWIPIVQEQLNLHSIQDPEVLLAQVKGNVWGIREQNLPALILRPDGESIENCLPQWLHFYLSKEAFSLRYEDILRRIETKIKQAKSRLKDNTLALQMLSQSRDPEEIGHLILAHAHAVPAGTELFHCDDLYTGAQIEIKLNKQLSPAENASAYYKKSRQRQEEVLKCQKAIPETEAWLVSVQQEYQSLLEIKDNKTLKLWLKNYPEWDQQSQKERSEKTNPWREFMIQGWQIRVGKNAKSNDELTLRHSRPGDLWLHVKDYSGSHVIVRRRQEQIFPEEIIQKAAGIAVWFSPRRHHDLVPVWVCDRKYIRKNKKMPPGAVQVERGETLMADSPKRLEDILK